MGRYSVEEYVRWEDIDAAGIINYQAYLRLFALAEVEMFRSCGLSYRVLGDELGIWLPRVRVECDFFQPVKLDDLLVVQAYFGHLGQTSVQINFEVRRKAELERVVASGKYVLVAVRQQDFTPVSLPQAFRAKVAPYAEAPEGDHRG